MPSKAAALLRYQRDTIAAQAISRQYDKSSTVGFVHRINGSTADVTINGDRLRVDFMGGSLRVGDAVNVQTKGFKYAKGFEGL